MKKFSWIVLFLAFLSINLQAQEVFPEVRAVWLSRDVVEQGRTSIRTAFQEYKTAGFNTVFINNWYLGSMIYSSQVLADYGGDDQLNSYNGWDPVQVVIEEGHRIGLEVHLWFEYGLIGYYSYPGQQTPGPILENHPDWLMTNRDGQDFYTDGYGNYQYWMDPAHPEVVDFITSLFTECAELYPQLDGIQTDRFRYPSTDYSFSEITRTAYQNETGGSDPITITSSDNEWGDFVAWRELQTTVLADTVYHAIKAINPELVISSAVVPPYMLNGSQDKLQDWPEWLDRHVVDYVAPMLYGLHYNFEYWLNQCLGVAPFPKRIIPGISIQDLNNSVISGLIQDSRDKHMPGVVVWYSGYLNEENRGYLAQNEFSNSATPATQDIIVDDGNSFDTDWQGFTQGTGGYLDMHRESNTAGEWFQWNLPVYSQGNYTVQAYIMNSSDAAGSFQYLFSLNGEATSFEIQPGDIQDHWKTITQESLESTDEISLTLQSQGNGTVFADAIRLRKSISLQIIEALAVDSQEVKIKFNQPITPASALNSAHYRIVPEVSVNGISSADDSAREYILSTATLLPDSQYVIQAWNLETEQSLTDDTLQASFRYVTGTSTLIDNSDEYFIVQSGNWQSMQDPESAIGGNYLTTPAGSGESRVYWRYPAPVEGFYDVRVYFPDSSGFVDDAMYLLKNATGFDTIRVNQQIAHPGGKHLGQVWADAGSNMVVKLHNSSGLPAEYLVVADAVRFELSFYSSNEDYPSDKMPHGFSLGLNYPNPFNAQTTVPFTISHRTQATIRIFNLSGNLVKQLDLGELAPGNYIQNINLNALSSGIYIYQFVTPSFTQTRKMTLIK